MSLEWVEQARTDRRRARAAECVLGRGCQAPCPAARAPGQNRNVPKLPFPFHLNWFPSMHTNIS